MISSFTGLESLFFFYKYSLQSNNDAVVLLVHWYLIQIGFKNLRENGIITEILPSDWNENQNSYTIKYTKDGKGYELKCLVVGEKLVVNLIVS
jgi:hypothetical protein